MIWGVKIQSYIFLHHLWHDWAASSTPAVFRPLTHILPPWTCASALHIGSLPLCQTGDSSILVSFFFGHELKGRAVQRVVHMFNAKNSAAVRGFCTRCFPSAFRAFQSDSWMLEKEEGAILVPFWNHFTAFGFGNFKRIWKLLKAKIKILRSDGWRKCFNCRLGC